MSRGCAELILSLIGCSALESWPHLSPATAFRRVGPEPYPGCTVDMTLVVGVLVSWLQSARDATYLSHES